MKVITSLKSYKNLCAEYYELDKPSAPKEARDYYLAMAEKVGGPILEPMCGTGRFLVPLLEAGHDVTGFDNSPQMLDVCRSKCQNKNLDCELLEGSFEDFKTQKKFNLIFIPSSSFCLLTDPKEAAKALELIHEWLAIDGKFIFEVETLNAVGTTTEIWKANWVKKADGSLIVLNHTGSFNEKTGVETILCRYEQWKNNAILQTEVEEFCLKLYSTEEIENLLNKHGFKIDKRLVPYSCVNADASSEVVLYECVKMEK